MSISVNDEDRLLNVKQAAEFLTVSASQLNKVRCTGGGPVFIRVGAGRGAIRYRIGDLKEWLASRRRRNTSEAA